VLARSQVAGLDAAAERALLLGVEERHLVDLLEIGLQAAFGRNDGAPCQGSALGWLGIARRSRATGRSHPSTRAHGDLEPAGARSVAGDAQPLERWDRAGPRLLQTRSDGRIVLVFSQPAAVARGAHA
jgi:hypothetical protein